MLNGLKMIVGILTISIVLILAVMGLKLSTSNVHIPVMEVVEKIINE